MDKISLKEMKLYGFTGCLPEEKKNGQYFYVSIDMMFRELKGAVTDELSDTVNYAEVYSIAESIVKDSSFDLIEHLAYEIGRKVISSYEMIDAVKVLVRKPDAPVDGIFESMETEIAVRRSEAVISFGSNMGDSEQTIRLAIDAIKQIEGVEVKRCSSLYWTEPVGYENQDDFLNGCLVISTYLKPTELLHELQRIELDLGRVRTIKNGPRTIDLDILLMSGVRLDTEELTIPHPRMYERAFVLVPLKELGLYNGTIPDDKAVRPSGIKFEV
ncbi:MAG: 2-amino-4-hydroxy-6-hydroxymethyldihydropteridine diphosphokinase [Clostridiales bacterium]|nr:2-amino-4-hydroxy-6-hydroxymethyldihydropteridine diphosphokinase [Clostridiales bacterium]